MQTAHILLVDPETERRDLLRAWLKRQGFLISAARGAEHARRILAGLDFDLVLVQPEDKADCLIDLTEAPFLWLGARPDGCRGEEMARPYDPSALVERINRILDLRPAAAEVTPRELRLGPLRYDLASGDLFEGKVRIALTQTETKLIRVLAGRPNAPITRAELADEVGDQDPSSRATDVQITRLRRKLESDPKNPRYLQTVRGTGYMLTPD